LLIEHRPVYDLFAGSGGLGLESLSRGAAHATLIESDPRVVSILRRNVEHLHYEHRTTVVTADVFRWVGSGRHWPREAAVVLVAPPYSYFDDRIQDLQHLWVSLVKEMPEDTVIVIQAPRHFAPALLPAGQEWETRRYGETQIAICQTCRT
jgi:16S rRNA (guanine966-N2)-methyltransferase